MRVKYSIHNKYFNFHLNTLYFTVMYLLSIDWWSTKAARSNVVTRNYMQTNMPGKYI